VSSKRPKQGCPQGQRLRVVTSPTDPRRFPPGPLWRGRWSCQSSRLATNLAVVHLVTYPEMTVGRQANYPEMTVGREANYLEMTVGRQAHYPGVTVVRREPNHPPAAYIRAVLVAGSPRMSHSFSLQRQKSLSAFFALS